METLIVTDPSFPVHCWEGQDIFQFLTKVKPQALCPVLQCEMFRGWEYLESLDLARSSQSCCKACGVVHLHSRGGAALSHCRLGKGHFCKDIQGFLPGISPGSLQCVLEG